MSIGPIIGDEAMPRSRSYQDKLLEDLKDPGEAAEYLNTALEEGDREMFLLALRNVADARGGISKLAESTLLNRENLYRMLSDKGNPEFYSLYTLLNALGFRLAVEAKEPDHKRETPPTTEPQVLVLQTRSVAASSRGKQLALAADTSQRELETIVAITPDGKEIGTLEYDFQTAELFLRVRGVLPNWQIIDVEIQTKDGEQLLQTILRPTGPRLVLLRGKPVKKAMIRQISLRPHSE